MMKNVAWWSVFPTKVWHIQHQSILFPNHFVLQSQLKVSGYLGTSFAQLET